MATMEGEMFRYMTVLLLVCVSLCYCYTVRKFPPKLALRLFAILPIVSLFLSLPLMLSSATLIGTTSFFIAWLANFKLLLFAFDKGPLCTHPSLSLRRFLLIASLPVKIHYKYPCDDDGITHLEESQNKQKNSILKGLLTSLILWAYYSYSEFIHPQAILVLYYVYIYFFLYMVLAMAAWLARFFLNMEMEPPFNKPYLSGSLQEFWGRRWNLMVHRLLHPAVYEPLRDLSAGVVGRKWAPLPAVFGTFSVSALMHELIYYYLGRVKPTWEVTLFFLLHGFCVMVQIGVGKAVNRRIEMLKPVSVVLTIGFVVVSGFWLFFPQLLRCDVFARGFEELAAVLTFVKDCFP